MICHTVPYFDVFIFLQIENCDNYLNLVQNFCLQLHLFDVLFDSSLISVLCLGLHDALHSLSWCTVLDPVQQTLPDK